MRVCPDDGGARRQAAPPIGQKLAVMVPTTVVRADFQKSRLCNGTSTAAASDFLTVVPTPDTSKVSDFHF